MGVLDGTHNALHHLHVILVDTLVEMTKRHKYFCYD
jgi:hypothetical protein